MIISEIKEKKAWEDFLLDCEEKTFLSSWNWGEFNKMMGSKIWRLGIYNSEQLFAVALVVKTVAKRGTFLLVPHGPSFAKVTEGKPNIKYEILKTLLEELKKIAREEKTSFIRVNPILERNEENNKLFRNLGFKQAPIQMHPEASWKLDITVPEERLLANMRKTTRYLIRQTAKNADIQIQKSADPKDIEIFSRMHEEISRRQYFVPFSLNYLENEFSIFQKDNQIALFFGKYQGKIAAASFVIFWSNIGFYHHAALLPQYHKIPIAYSLQWEAIKEAKKRGCKLYDFWGYVDPQKQPRHPWAGPTLFKMGFGGRAYEYVKTQDFPLSKKYWLTYLFEKLRKTKRGL